MVEPIVTQGEVTSMNALSSERRRTVPGAVTHCQYQQADSTQTLREGLSEYYRANPNLFSPEELAADQSLGDLGKFFAAHDACHVLFGLDTSLPDETLADTWTLFGTDVEWKEIWSYMRSDGQKQFFAQFFRDVGYWRTIRASLGAIPRALRAIWRARKMTRKWSLHGWRDHLDVPLHELRRRYGIHLV
jgi:hypothetical protein